MNSTEYNMKTVAIVPARKGSKRLPGKNVKLLAGKPLIQYTIESVQKAACFDRVIISSDDMEIHRLFCDVPGIHLDERPPDFATDEVQCDQVLHYIISKYNLVEQYDYLCMLQPTCPLRNENHIRESFKIVKEKKPDSVVSVQKYYFPPQFALDTEGEFLVKKWDGIVRTDTVEPKYHSNGAIVWLKIKKFHYDNMISYYTNNTYPYMMDWKSSVDIDDYEGFEMAQMIMCYEKSEIV
ncbi:MAG: acylneuraminate cytidylyltransferase family protein [Desulfobacterales bacterium]|nr:acylneuraminate cytidylyltransferase family protein [Desulfobacterales bacterium]